MTELERQEDFVMTPRQALGLLYKLAYRKFGKDTLPIIEEVCFKLGIADGQRIKKGMPNLSFKTAQERFLHNARKKGIDTEIIELTETKRHTKFYGPCILRLENSSRELCEAAMALDKGMFETAIGAKLNLKILKTLAAGDPYCEVLWTLSD